MTIEETVHNAHQLKVRAIDREGTDACAVTFEVPDGAEEEFSYRPGQFVTIRVWIDDDWHARCYSVCDWDTEPGLIRIGVKEIRDGLVSGWINKNLAPGDVVWCLPPSGVFTPSRLDAPLALFAGGSGITPILAIAKAALAAGSQDVTLCYANRCRNQVMFRNEIEMLLEHYPQQFTVDWWMDDESGLMSSDVVADIADGRRDSEFLVCGPGPFMKLVTEALSGAGIGRHQVHVEKFQSLEGDPFVVERDDQQPTGEQVEVTVTFYGETHKVPWDKSKNLLVALESAGLAPPFSCREGRCSSCACRLLEGEVRMLKNNALEPEDLADQLILSCQSVPVSDTVAVEYE